MNNNKLQKNSAIFLATVLVAGVIGMATPFAAYADDYRIAKCDLTNVNINGIEQSQGQAQSATEELSGEDLETDEEALDALFGGNDEPLLNLERNIVNVCFNDNENNNVVTVAQSQGQAQLPLN